MFKFRNLLLGLLLLIPGAAFAANTAPHITSAASTSFTVAIAGKFTVTATGSPAPTFTEIGVLPSGVTLTAAGLLSGTPATGTFGTYPVTITAANGTAPNATQSFTLTVIPLHFVGLSFTASITTGVTSYNIYRTQCIAPVATVGGAEDISCPAGAPAPAVIGTTTTTSYQDNNVAAGQSYQYYATSVCPTCTDSTPLTAASLASGGDTTYTGAFPTGVYNAGATTTITGFTNAGNNGAFTVVSCSPTALVVANAGGVAETHAGAAVVPVTESVASNILVATIPPAAPGTVIISSQVVQ
jgi:hypothetical protein